MDEFFKGITSLAQIIVIGIFTIILCVIIAFALIMAICLA